MSTAAESSAAEHPAQSRPLIGKGMVVLFIALACCFTAWGVAADICLLYTSPSPRDTR